MGHGPPPLPGVQRYLSGHARQLAGQTIAHAPRSRSSARHTRCLFPRQPTPSPGGGSSRRPFTACCPLSNGQVQRHPRPARAVALACATSKIGLSSTSFEAASQTSGPVPRPAKIPPAPTPSSDALGRGLTLLSR